MTLKIINPRKLLTSNRMDLISKIYLAKKILNKKNKLYEETQYLETIKYINYFVEKDKKNKVGKKKFLKDFNSIINSIKKKGFSKKFPLLVDKKTKTLVDGAHRLSAAIALNLRKVYYINVNKGVINLGYKDFINRLIPYNYIENIAYKFCLLDKNTRFIFLWPNVNFEKNESFLIRNINKFGHIIYKKKILLTDRGKINLIKNIYKKEKWVLRDNNNNFGIRNKSFNCFKDKNYFNLFIIKKRGNLSKLKNNLRNKFGFGKHSLHTNDKYHETVELAQILLNQNSLHNLNYRIENKFSWHQKLHNEFKKWIKLNNYSIEDFCIEGSSVLSAYGLRSSRDIDYLSNYDIKKKLKYKEISDSSLENKKYFRNIADLINNPINYFYYEGLKYLNLKNIKLKKNKRRELKDIQDLQLVDKLKNKTPDEFLYKLNFRDCLNLIFIKNLVKFFLLKLRFYYFKVFIS